MSVITVEIKTKESLFGGVVTNRKNISGSTRSNFEVIDGQQRLATFVLLISRIVKHIEALIKDINENEDAGKTTQEKILLCCVSTLNSHERH